MKFLEIAENDCYEIKRKILIVDDRDFFGRIVERGKEYFHQRKVKNLKKIDEKTYTANVNGTEEYNVIVKMNGRFCLDADCTCPFNEVDDGYINAKLCKHIYATYMAIYELENKEYLKNCIRKYKEKYLSLYMEVTKNIDNLKFNFKDEKSYEQYKKDFTELYKSIQDNFYDELTLEENFELLYDFINKSAQIFDLLYDIKNNIKEDRKSKIDENDFNKNKENIIIKILKVFWAIILGLLGCSINLEDRNETINEENSFEEKIEFSHGDTVIVRYSGKIGIIISIDNDYYTVKLKDENENEYYASYSENELERYY